MPHIAMGYWDVVAGLDQLDSSIKVCEFPKQLEVWVGSKHGCHALDMTGPKQLFTALTTEGG
jgi:hypothetical protein